MSAQDAPAPSPASAGPTGRSSGHERPEARTAVRTGAAVALVAVVGNLLVLLLARALGASMVVAPPGGGDPAPVGVAMVVGATVLPLVLGTVALVLARRWGARAWRLLALAGLVAGVVTVGAPLSAAEEAGTGVALALMHVLTGGAWALLVLRATARGGAASR